MTSNSQASLSSIQVGLSSIHRKYLKSLDLVTLIHLFLATDAVLFSAGCELLHHCPFSQVTINQLEERIDAGCNGKLSDIDRFFSLLVILTVINICATYEECLDDIKYYCNMSELSAEELWQILLYGDSEGAFPESTLTIRTGRLFDFFDFNWHYIINEAGIIDEINSHYTQGFAQWEKNIVIYSIQTQSKQTTIV